MIIAASIVLSIDIPYLFAHKKDRPCELDLFSESARMNDLAVGNFDAVVSGSEKSSVAKRCMAQAAWCLTAAGRGRGGFWRPGVLVASEESGRALVWSRRGEMDDALPEEDRAMAAAAP